MYGFFFFLAFIAIFGMKMVILIGHLILRTIKKAGEKMQEGIAEARAVEDPEAYLKERIDRVKTRIAPAVKPETESEPATAVTP